MENYVFLENDGLTGYDKYVLSKRNQRVEETPSFAPVIEEKSIKAQNEMFFERNDQTIEKNEKRKLSDYDKYLYDQLNRTTPSYEKVMTKEEFYSSNVEKKTERKNVFSKMFNNVSFKKGGKLILAFYVIIMVVLASILVVANTTDTFAKDFAIATQDSVSENKSIVSSMTIEEKDSNEDNWFDRLCDAINK